MMGAFPIALKRTTTLDESFFLYVSKAASACAGYGVPVFTDTDGTEGDPGDKTLASIDVEAILVEGRKGRERY
jgi:hypothetical protein